MSDLPSVHDFVEQYRAAYNAACQMSDHPRPKTSEAYNNIFNVENRTDDLLEAQIILEKERLLWEIVRVGALEPLVETLKNMDPLYLATTAKLLGQIEVYNEVDGDEELTYRMDKQEPKDLQVISKYVACMNIALCLCLELIKYIKGKIAVLEWRSDDLAKGGVNSMALHGSNIAKLLGYLKDNMGITFDDILADEGIKIWLLNPKNLDECGRVKKAMNPKNLEYFKDIVDNEILPGLTPAQACMRATDKKFYFDID